MDFMNENFLTQLQKYSIVVADTGEFEKIEEFKPQDATTNPSLILNAAKKKEYQNLIDEGVQWSKNQAGNRLTNAVDKIAVNFGKAILQIIPGYVSTEVDARLSFDTEKTIEKARRLIELYAKENIPKEKILIKIAATWEGIQAATVLEKESIHCNLTLIFHKYQAIQCANSNVFLISPFVGRILDWHKKNTGKEYSFEDDPGVCSVREIYRYFKAFGHSTIVMGASFRNIEEILELAGCDRLTISPNLMKELKDQNHKEISPKLFPNFSSEQPLEKITINEEVFRWNLNEDPMTTEKLAEGIRNFAKDTIQLENIIQAKF